MSKSSSRENQLDLKMPQLARDGQSKCKMAKTCLRFIKTWSEYSPTGFTPVWKLPFKKQLNYDERMYSIVCVLAHLFPVLFPGITVLLSLTVFMLLVAEIMPATSDSVPLIGKKLLHAFQ